MLFLRDILSIDILWKRNNKKCQNWHKGFAFSLKNCLAAVRVQNYCPRSARAAGEWSTATCTIDGVAKTATGTATITMPALD